MNMYMKSTCSTYDRNIIVHSTDRYPFRSYKLQYMCAAQLTSRLIAWRCDETRPPLALDCRDQHRLRLPVVGSMVFNCRGLENLREVLESQKERSFQAYLSPSKKMTMRMPWSTTVWFSSAVSSTTPTASETSPCQGWSRGTWTASHRPRAALRRSRRDSAGRRRSSSVPPREPVCDRDRPLLGARRCSAIREALSMQ